MRTSIRLLMPACLLVLVVGCASTGTPAASSGLNDRVDGQYVAAVEALARKQGTRVMWINPPQRPLQQTASR